MQNRAQLIRMIMIISREEVAEYFPGVGAKCPVCSRLGIDPPIGPTYWSKEIPVRYHTCPICTHRFKSIQKIQPEIIPIDSKTPTNIAKGRRRRHSSK